MNPIENVWNITKKEIGNQMLCKKKNMWKRVCEAWYSVAPNILEEFYNSMPRRIADLNKDKVGATKFCLYDVGEQECCYVFIGMYLRMLLCFQWNVFDINIQCCLIICLDMIYRNKMA